MKHYLLSVLSGQAVIVTVDIKRLDSSAKESIYGKSFGNLETRAATWAGLDNPPTNNPRVKKRKENWLPAACWAKPRDRTSVSDVIQEID